MGQTEPTVSIVVINWNTCTLLDELLASIGLTTTADFCETIVVDNGSKDGSSGMVERKHPGVRLIRNPDNKGYAAANNQGFAIARGKYVLLLGSDTVLHEGTVRTLTEFLDGHQGVGAAGCRLLNPDGTPQASCKRFPRLRDAAWTYLSLHRFARHYDMHDFDFYRTQPVDQPAGTCLLIRREILARLRGFDERYRILYNDVDLCERIRSAGWDIYYVAETELTHHGSVTTRSAPAAVRLEMYRNILLYYRTRFGARAQAVLVPVLFVRLLAATRSPIAFRLLKGGEGHE